MQPALARNLFQAGELVSRHDWGVRATAFEVRKRTEGRAALVRGLSRDRE